MVKRVGIELAGVTVSRVTGINAKFIIDSGIGPGAIIEVTRSGEVIPKITRVIKPVKPSTPSDGGFKWAWNKTKVDAILLEGVQHTGSEVKQIDAFLSQGLGVEHVAEGILAKMYAAGFKTIAKVLAVTPSKLLTVPGIKDTMAQKIYSQIQNGCADADINKVAANSGFFGTGLGSKRIKLISDKYDLFRLAAEPKSRILDKVSAIHGFSTITAKQFSEHLAEFINWVNRLPIKFKKAEVVKVTGSKFAGKSVCFTGVRSAEAEAQIIEQGGKISSGVSSATTLLVVKDPGSTSSKAEKARSLGIKIVSLDQLNKMLG